MLEPKKHLKELNHKQNKKKLQDVTCIVDTERSNNRKGEDSKIDDLVNQEDLVGPCVTFPESTQNRLISSIDTVQVQETTPHKEAKNTSTPDKSSIRTDTSMDDFDDGIDRDKMSSLEVNKNFNCRRSVQTGFGIKRP